MYQGHKNGRVRVKLETYLQYRDIKMFVVQLFSLSNVNHRVMGNTEMLSTYAGIKRTFTI